MGALVSIKLPDIGDFEDVEVVEVMVKPGDRVRVDDSLITIESDKASMEVPATEAGVVKELKVKVGDRVLISKYGGTEIKIDGNTFQVLREDDILGILA